MKGEILIFIEKFSLIKIEKEKTKYPTLSIIDTPLNPFILKECEVFILVVFISCETSGTQTYKYLNIHIKHT